MGDRRADSMKNTSSLRIKAGQIFGGEEVGTIEGPLAESRYGGDTEYEEI